MAGSENRSELAFVLDRMTHHELEDQRRHDELLGALTAHRARMDDAVKLAVLQAQQAFVQAEVHPVVRRVTALESLALRAKTIAAVIAAAQTGALVVLELWLRLHGK